MIFKIIFSDWVGLAPPANRSKHYDVMHRRYATVRAETSVSEANTLTRAVYRTLLIVNYDHLSSYIMRKKIAKVPESEMISTSRHQEASRDRRTSPKTG